MGELYLKYSLIFLCSWYFLCTRYTQSYSGGAPDFACVDMVPGHGVSPQSSTAPYMVTPSVNSIEGGQRLAVEIKASENPVKGFFIQARKVGSDAPIGTFFSDGHKTISCGTGVENAITHQSRNNADQIKVEWEAPSDLEGDIEFKATVVEEYSTFWTDVRSDTVTVKKRSVPVNGDGSSRAPSGETATERTRTQETPIQGMSIAEDLASLYDGCGTSKTCYGFPSGCETTKSCEFMVTYTDAGSGLYEFELKGQGGSGRYVAVGLSFDAIMGGDSVTVCGSGDRGVDIFMKYNEGKSNENILKPKEGLRALVSGDMDGQLYCKFQLNEVIRTKNNQQFDLKNVKFHIMVAEGTLVSDDQLQYHGTRKIVNTRPVSLGQTSNLEQRDTRFFKMIHGCLMISAWVLAASCGIMFARYFKQTWKDYKCCNLDQWFHFHRLFMILTWSASVVALVLIIYELGEFRLTNHSIIGIVSFGLCFIQPFMAALRPHPNTKNRPIFNWLHWMVGNSAQILGIAAIFLGLGSFLGPGRNWVKELDWYILVAFIAFHCIVHILLSISQCCSEKRPKSTDVFPMKEFGGSRMMLRPENSSPDAPYGFFRKFILGLYLPINWIVTAFLIITVVFKREEIEDQLVQWGSPRFWENL